MKLTPEMITEQYGPEVYQEIMPDLAVPQTVVDEWLNSNKNLLKKAHVAHCLMMEAQSKEAQDFELFCVYAYYYATANEAVQNMINNEINEMVLGK